MERILVLLAALAVMSASCTPSSSSVEMTAGTAGRLQTKAMSLSVGGVVMKGYLVYDPTVEGRRPGVLVVHEWWGLNDYARMRADMLARMGYAALAVDMYGNGRVAEDRAEAGRLAGDVRGDPALARSRAGAWLAELKRQPMVDPSRTAAIGYCFGGTIVLELARSGADVGGVVSFHGGLATKQPARRGEVRATVLVLHGAADTSVPPDQVQAFQEEMTAAGADWYLTTYAHAKHGFTNPGSDRHEANADRRSWAAMQQFFDELFRGEGSDR